MIKEACIEKLEEAIACQKQGATRVELCGDLLEDGLTPSFELMQQARAALHIPIFTMIRPRGGNFVYSAEEVEAMKVDIDKAKETGADGVVFGLLTPDNQIDEANTRMLAEYAFPLPVTFHKAIDVMESQVEGVRVLKNIPNIKRILTSGGKPTAKEGAETICKMAKEAEGKIIMVVAGKVTSENVDELNRIIGSNELHGKKIVGELL